MKRSIYLRLELSNVTGEENHGKTKSEENVDNPSWKIPETGSLNRTSRHVHAENYDDNHKLTSQKVPVEVVSLVGDGSTLVGDWVRISVKLLVYWRKSYKGSLSSLNHGKPKDSNPDKNVSCSWM